MYLDIGGTFRNINSPVKFELPPISWTQEMGGSSVYHGVCLYGTTAGYGAGADTNISICNRWERNLVLDVTDLDERVRRQTNISICNIWNPNPRLTVTDRDKENRPHRMSQSVTVTRQIQSQMLQI